MERDTRPVICRIEQFSQLRLPRWPEKPRGHSRFYQMPYGFSACILVVCTDKLHKCFQSLVKIWMYASDRRMDYISESARQIPRCSYGYGGMNNCQFWRIILYCVLDNSREIIRPRNADVQYVQIKKKLVDFQVFNQRLIIKSRERAADLTSSAEDSYFLFGEFC